MTDGSTLTEARREALLVQTRRLAQLAREEDLGRGDITGALLTGQGTGRFRMIAKEGGVFAGREIAQTILDAYQGGLTIEWREAGVDGRKLGDPQQDLAWIEGPVDKVLAAERVLLNFLQRLSGIATLTSRFVEAVAGTNAIIMDTRKTTPGWRHLEKYAVRCGGGQNHRLGLHDAILIKDNHLSPFGPEETAAAVLDMLSRAARLDPPPVFVEVEADGLAQVEQLLGVSGVDVVMLDNFALDDVRRAVALRDSRNLRGKVKLEASGSVTLNTVADIAGTGVDCISVGAITHSAAALDLSLERVG